MRRIILAALAIAACDIQEGRPASPPQPTGVTVPEDSTGGSSTGDLPRLDLGGWPDLPAEPAASSTGDDTGEAPAPTTGGEWTTTGEAGPESSTGDASTGEAGSTSSGSSSTGDGSTGGEPVPPDPVCGDGVCVPSEHAPCFGPGWCPGDCLEHPDCLSDCPCTAEAAAAMNFCGSLPGDCAAVKPGGYCDPDGDGGTGDGDWVKGWQQWSAACG